MISCRPVEGVRSNRRGDRGPPRIVTRSRDRTTRPGASGRATCRSTRRLLGWPLGHGAVARRAVDGVMSTTHSPGTTDGWAMPSNCSLAVSPRPHLLRPLDPQDVGCWCFRTSSVSGRLSVVVATLGTLGSAQSVRSPDGPPAGSGRPIGGCRSKCPEVRRDDTVAGYRNG